MEKQDFEKCCRAMEEGEEILLENMISHVSGRPLYCSAEGFKVDVGGKRESWPADACEEIGSSSESPHGNI